MKVALIGKGKTGSKILELLEGIDVLTFDSQNKPNKYKLRNVNVIISFVPGNIFKEMLPMLLQTKIPVISGSTGFDWPASFKQDVKKEQVTWIHGQNFSIGMNLIKKMIEVIKNASSIFDNYQINLTETHHTKKLDAPSGTAKLWQDWLGEKIDIKSIRTGDVKGIHELVLKTEHEAITLTHEALDRRLFAQGAIWAAHEVINNPTLEFGVLNFSDLISNKLLEQK